MTARLLNLLPAPWVDGVAERWPGILTAITIAFAATFVSEHQGGPQLLYALFFGMAFNFAANGPKIKPGIDFASRQVLRFGVGLLGVRITLEQISGLGAAPILLVVGALVATILFGAALGRVLRRPVAESVLAGGAVAICGASAALAISAVLVFTFRWTGSMPKTSAWTSSTPRRRSPASGLRI